MCTKLALVPTRLAGSVPNYDLCPNWTTTPPAPTTAPIASTTRYIELKTCVYFVFCSTALIAKYSLSDSSAMAMLRPCLLEWQILKALSPNNQSHVCCVGYCNSAHPLPISVPELGADSFDF